MDLTRTKSMIAIVGVLSLAVALIALSGVSQKEDVFKDTYRIYVVVHGGIADPFWKVVEQGVRDAAANHDDLKVTYSGPPSYDFTKFMSDINSALAAEPDALVCTLTEPKAMDSVLRPAIKDGLPVFGINAPDLRPEEKRIPVETYIGEDSYFIGVTAAKESLKRFTPQHGLYVNHHPGARNIEARGNGFIDTLKGNGISVDELNITADPIKGAELTLDYLEAHPKTDLIFSGNTQRTEAIVKRLEDEGIEVGKDVKIAQMDISPGILDYIEEGKVMFTMDQEQYMQGYLGVELAYLKVKYGLAPPPAPVSTGPAVITKEDVPTLKKLAEKQYR